MQPNNPLDEILMSPVSLKILRHMVTFGGEQTGRMTAKECGISYVQAHRILDGFVKQGIVLKRRAGSAYLFKVNESHLIITRLLKPLFETERALTVNALRENIGPIDKYISSAVVFGSVADGTSRYDSDVDLFLLLKDAAKREEVKDRAASISVDFAGATGNRLDVLVMTPSEYKSAKKSGKSVIESVEQGKLICGKPVAEALRGK